MRRGAWSGRYAFYLATVGSAFSLGNLWRFPYVVDSNGGGAFVVTYLLLCILVGMPIVIAELMAGKYTGLSVIPAAEKISLESSQKWIRDYKPWVFVARVAHISSIFLLAFYSVICGWVLFFVYQYGAHFMKQEMIPDSRFQYLMDSGGIQVGLLFIHICITTLVVSKGLRQGIEKLSTLIMPLFMGIMLYLVIKALSLSGTTNALRFLFYPNFSYFTAETLQKVLGHVFFTLSVGMGAMVVFGSYLKSDVYVPHAGFKVALLDITISIFSGLLIFPIVFSANISGDSGPALVFNAMILFFNKMGWGNFLGFSFFVCLYFAALGASIMLLESSVSHFIDSLKWTRSRSTFFMASIVFFVALPAALSSSVLKDVILMDMSILRLYDNILVDYMLPLVCLGTSLMLGFGVSSKTKKELFIKEDEMDSEKLYENWNFLLRWIVPFLIVLGFILSRN